MPIFTNKLLNRKAPRRKIVRSDIMHKNQNCYGSDLTLKLGELKTTFDNGRWISEFNRYNETSQENSYLKIQVNELTEENNLLKLKYEILLDMLAHQCLSNEA